jgi:hypothetical protein
MFVAVFAGAANEARSQDITAEERDQLLAKLEKSRKEVEEATRGLSAAQWNFKPNILRWSVAECVEHIALTEDFLFNIVQQMVKGQPQTTKKDLTAAREVDQGIQTAVANRTTRFPAPEPVRPKHQTASPQELVSRFAASRGRTIEFVKGAKDLRSYCADGPLGKCTDAYQWLLLLSGHSERHFAQLIEVRADARFPK